MYEKSLLVVNTVIEADAFLAAIGLEGRMVLQDRGHVSY